MRLTQLQHDAYARTTLYRVLVTQAGAECAWCASPGRFRYFWWPDDRNSAPYPPRGTPAFCSAACWRSDGR